jgi:hypothetical protein
MVLLQVLSSVAVALACFAISATLALLVHRARSIPFRAALLAFALFLAAGGLTSLFGALVIWSPVYWLEGGMRAATGLAGLAAALMLATMAPRAIALCKPALPVRSPDDLRNTLGLILGPTERLLAAGNLSSEQRRELEQVQSEARSALDSIER